MSEGIRRPSNSPWRAQVLVTSGENQKRRMVIDYSHTINRFTELDAYPLPNIDEMVNNIARYKVFSTLDLKSAYHQVAIREEERPYTAFEAGGKLYEFSRIPFGVEKWSQLFQRVLDEILKKEKVSGSFAYVDNVTVCGETEEEHDQNLTEVLKVAEEYNLTLNHNKSSLRMTMGLLAHYSRWIPKFSEKILPLTQANGFPLSTEALLALGNLKKDIASAVVTAIDPSSLFTVETDASDHAIAATLTQNDCPVAFFSRTLTRSEQGHSSVEKEAYAIVEALGKWRHYLIGHHFKLITDQRSVKFMFDSKSNSKIKNDKIARLNLDFKGPVPSQSRNKYLLTVVDEFSRFPFVFPCADMTTRTVISCLVQLFALFGMPAYIHTDRGACFMSEELKDFLMKKGVATSRTTPYNPKGNGQAEKYNGVIWKTLTLALKTRNLDVSQWETVLPDALHCIRSLLCTSMNCTPHERLFLHSRRSTTGQSLPTWLIQGGPALLRRHVRYNKNDPLVDEVEIVEANPKYAHVKLPDGRVTTVSLRHLAPMASDNRESTDAGVPVSQSEVPEELSVANAPQEIGRGLSHVDIASQHDTLQESHTVPQQVASPPPLRSIGQALASATRPQFIHDDDHVFGSRWLMDQLNKLDFCVGMDEVTKYKQSAMANDIYDKEVSKLAESFTQRSADNVDHNVRTLNGKGSV
ncbi:LOW QUALITY PROTEIN: uncharacterized protein LOC135204401 [Macrobrachium nipponense]|uniref:LOW QUALITY PROTEIN: uncharacterized protein LOC135204401 n=1 Tax=Macrobrachium nipponense TaxID=159736 RepID=UPI0030C81C02